MSMFKCQNIIKMNYYWEVNLPSIILFFTVKCLLHIYNLLILPVTISDAGRSYFLSFYYSKTYYIPVTVQCTCKNIMSLLRTYNGVWRWNMVVCTWERDIDHVIQFFKGYKNISGSIIFFRENQVMKICIDIIIIRIGTTAFLNCTFNLRRNIII